MSELRDQISSIVTDYDPSGPGQGDTAEEIADRILAIPEVAEALLLRSTALRRYLEAARPMSMTEIAERYGDALQNSSPLAQFVRKEDLPHAR